MQWGQIIDIHAGSATDDPHNAEERRLAQLIGARLVMFLGKNSTLDDDDWQGLFGWLCLSVPEEAQGSRRYSDYAPALKQWWADNTAEMDPTAPIGGPLITLCELVAELLQLRPLETQLMTFSLLWLRHPQMNPILTCVEETRAKKLLTQLTGHSSDEVEHCLQERSRLKMLGLLRSHRSNHGLSALDMDDVLLAGPYCAAWRR
ncbi:hypothetical protein GLV89_09135 [Halomonas alkaliantarctica]|nr:hypothetical protein [Halomonas alkaliantarctica]